MGGRFAINDQVKILDLTKCRLIEKNACRYNPSLPNKGVRWHPSKRWNPTGASPDQKMGGAQREPITGLEQSPLLARGRGSPEAKKTIKLSDVRRKQKIRLVLRSFANLRLKPPR